ncbi:MAG: sigma-70 family RNA polymerase sigma factor [Vicinamibacteria bacterium]
MRARDAAIEQLYRDLGPALLAYARSLLHDTAAAEDALHQVFLKLTSTPGAMPDEPRPYLFKAIRNASFNRMRSDSRYSASRIEPSMFVARDALSDLVPDLERALAELPDEQREVVLLRVWGGLTLAAAAEVTGVSPNTAASRYRYGLARLRERLGRHLRATHA